MSESRMEAIEERVAIAQQLAIVAGEIARTGFLEMHKPSSGGKPKLEVISKGVGVNDIFTQADSDCERVITRGWKEHFPRDGIVGEEGASAKSTSGFISVVDPIDGTLNFTRGRDFFAVSIGICEGERSVGGVVYDPMRRELFVGMEGMPSTLNGESIQVSSQSDLSRAECLVEFGFNPARYEDLKKFLNMATSEVAALPRIMSAVIEGCWIAAGRFDLGLFCGMKWWDHAAVAPIIKGAGGFCGTSTKDEPDVGFYLASNDALKEPFRDLVRSANMSLTPKPEPEIDF